MTVTAGSHCGPVHVTLQGGGIRDVASVALEHRVPLLTRRMREQLQQRWAHADSAAQESLVCCCLLLVLVCVFELC